MFWPVIPLLEINAKELNQNIKKGLKWHYIIVEEGKKTVNDQHKGMVRKIIAHPFSRIPFKLNSCFHV